MADTFRDAGDGKKATATLLANGATVSGTLAEMAADALLLTTANEGKRWQATDDSDRIYSYRLVGTTWDYYLESGTDVNGGIRTSSQVSNFPVQASQDILFVPEFTIDMSVNTNWQIINDIGAYRHLQIDAKGLTTAEFEVKFFLDDAQIDVTAREGMNTRLATLTAAPSTLFGTGTWINVRPILANSLRIRAITTAVETGTFNVTLAGGS